MVEKAFPPLGVFTITARLGVGSHLLSIYYVSGSVLGALSSCPLIQFVVLYHTTQLSPDSRVLQINPLL